jgi:hypothetical protein
MDALLCRLTNGKWSKSRAYSLDFMVSCVDEEYEDAYEKERAELVIGTCNPVETATLENATAHVMECDMCGCTYEHVNGGYPRCPHCGRKAER